MDIGMVNVSNVPCLWSHRLGVMLGLGLIPSVNSSAWLQPGACLRLTLPRVCTGSQPPILRKP